MAYHTIANLRQRNYSASNLSSTTAAVQSVTNRGVLTKVYQAGKVVVASTAVVGSWTVSLNGTQVAGLSSAAVPAMTLAAGAVGVQTTNASPTALTNVYSGDVLSVVGSSLVASQYTFVVREF